MPPVDRLKPTRGKSSESTLSLMEFMREFPDDDACLEWLWRTRYSEDGETAHCPKCDRDRIFKRYKTTQRVSRGRVPGAATTFTRPPGRSSTSPLPRSTCGSTRCT
jgi:hypothetical protein